MSRGISIRLRMLILFCTVVGVLLALTFAGFYFVFERAAENQLDRRLQEIAAPIIADLIVDPDEKDVDQLNIDQEYFEVLDRSGHVVQRSKNLQSDLPLTEHTPFQSARNSQIGDVRIATLPFQAGGEPWIFVAAASTREVEEAVTNLRNFALFLFPASLLLTALIFRFYSNQLFLKIDSAVGQLRQFVSDASHELRTPLAVLHGETELLLARPRTTSEYESAARILDGELKKLSRIVDGLFTLSMADAGQLRIAPEPLYLEEVLEESCALAAPMAHEKQIRIERDLQHDVLYSGDTAFLRQLFLIFIDNAIKYSPAGTRLHISLSTSEEVQIRFKDEGFGIAKEHVSRIFERFFRAPQTDSPENHSGGLGLAIAQAIVQAHHGSIECVTELGRGSIFTVRLPRTSG
jgi:two-component system, OmpR family, sensor histidine kinase CiaH